MENKFEKTKTKNLKATARPAKSMARSSGLKSNQPDNKSKQDNYDSQLEKLETVTNSRGEVFKVGDLIQIKDLRDLPTRAKIKYFYSEPRGMMAVYVPTEKAEAGWEWFKGCSLLDALVKADSLIDD